MRGFYNSRMSTAIYSWLFYSQCQFIEKKKKEDSVVCPAISWYWLFKFTLCVNAGDICRDFHQCDAANNMLFLNVYYLEIQLRTGDIWWFILNALCNFLHFKMRVWTWPFTQLTLILLVREEFNISPL